MQTKLRINAPGDEYEQEADRVAEQVLRMPDSAPDGSKALSFAAPMVQRRVGGGSAGIGAAPPIVHEVLASPGAPLDASTRAFFEPRFGHDFSHVRVHAGAYAADSALAVNALAFTVGSDIVFGAGQYMPQTSPGSRVLAHELAHVAQQAAGGTAIVHRLAPAQSTAAWDELYNEPESATWSLEELLAATPSSRAKLQSDVERPIEPSSKAAEIRTFAPSAKPTPDVGRLLEDLVRVTALDLMKDYRQQVIEQREAARQPERQGAVLLETRKIAQQILELDKKKRELVRLSVQTRSLRRRTGGPGSIFAEDWTGKDWWLEVARLTKDYPNGAIDAAKGALLTWLEQHGSISEGDTGPALYLLYELDEARVKQVNSVNEEINALYLEAPFLAQFYLKDSLTEEAEQWLDDQTGDIVGALKTAWTYVDPFDLSGAKHAVAEVVESVRSRSGPTLTDFAEQSFGAQSSYVSAVLDAYDKLVTRIDKAIVYIGAGRIVPFMLPVAVQETRKQLRDPTLQKRLDNLKKDAELSALARDLGLTVLEAGLALIPVVGEVLALATGVYASARDAKALYDRSVVGAAAGTPEGTLGVESPKSFEVVAVGAGVVATTLDAASTVKGHSGLPDRPVTQADIDLPKELPALRTEESTDRIRSAMPVLATPAEVASPEMAVAVARVPPPAVQPILEFPTAPPVAIPSRPSPAALETSDSHAVHPEIAKRRKAVSRERGQEASPAPEGELVQGPWKPAPEGPVDPGPPEPVGASLIAEAEMQEVKTGTGPSYRVPHLSPDSSVGMKRGDSKDPASNPSAPNRTPEAATMGERATRRAENSRRTAGDSARAPAATLERDNLKLSAEKLVRPDGEEPAGQSRRRKFLKLLHRNSDHTPFEFLINERNLLWNAATFKHMGDELADVAPAAILGEKHGGPWLADAATIGRPDLAELIEPLPKSGGNLLHVVSAFIQERKSKIPDGSRFAFLESYMGGHAHDRLNAIISEMASVFPTYKFHAFWLRETAGLEMPVRGQVSRAFKGQDTTQEGAVTHHWFQVPFIVGEDTARLLSDEADGQPILIFNHDGDVIESFEPLPEESNRAQLLRLLSEWRDR